MSDPDLRLFAAIARGWRYPQNPMPIVGPLVRDPRDVLEELRETNPDEHALLTEYLVFPPKHNAA